VRDTFGFDIKHFFLARRVISPNAMALLKNHNYIWREEKMACQFMVIASDF